MAFRVAEIASLVMAVLFLVAVALQLNDPDPVLWMAIYGSAAVFSALHARNRLPWPAAAVFASSCLLAALFLARRVVGEHSLIGSEPGHEMLGLFLVACWVGWLAVNRYQRSRRVASRP